MKRLVILCAVVFVAALAVGLVTSQLLPARTSRAVAPLTAPADAPPQGSLVTFEGVVKQGSATVPSSWVVDFYSFQVVTATEIITNGLAVQAGVWARVEAVKDEEQSLQASIVELQGAPKGDIFDRVVTIDDGAGIWQVGDTEVIISDQTNIQGTPAVDALVYVRGQWSLDGLAADQAIFESQAEQVIYQGTIVQQQGSQLLVDDVVVDRSDSPPVIGDLEIGALVEVYGVETSPRHLRAQLIIVSSGTTEFQQREGWLVSVEDHEFPYLWRVNLLEGTGIVPVNIAIFEYTEIDETAASADYRSWLDIQVDNIGSGYYRARRIVVLPHPPKQTVTGIVEEMPAAGTLGRWRVSGHRVDVVADTAIIGAPQVGSLVTVLGTPDYSNALAAESIQALGQ